jgi:hypothetical protein
MAVLISEQEYHCQLQENSPKTIVILHVCSYRVHLWFWLKLSDEKY